MTDARVCLCNVSASVMFAELLSPDTWVTSDQHWGHKNIGKYTKRPDDHFELMRMAWDACVQPGDVVLHLGDLIVYTSLNSERAKLGMDLPGIKGILLGNHDNFPQAWYRWQGFEILGRQHLDWIEPNGTRVRFSHYPAGIMNQYGHFDPRWDLGWDINVHGHIHRNLKSDRVRYRNVCVEHTNYAPVRLGDVLDRPLGPW